MRQNNNVTVICELILGVGVMALSGFLVWLRNDPDYLWLLLICPFIGFSIGEKEESA